ncbi:Retrovirus-related Pol polyprotein from transposon TNT 1-94 [Trichinella murrelli]|uniref:Retrovirus-related Pol polyprotein from transposon TNT 1-94 n=1 Tax=Trichinella murrelli TaxID=144512 RepID=A0A0V0T5Z2_9BILA|nr:Retrovirus-related Pol polyprotein from transposon TNT 1-94 [Trichinella murrelli]
MRTAMPYTPEQNGVAERENRILVETGRSMLHSKDLPLSLWAEAVNTACHVLNRTGPTTVKGKSPMELWFKRDPVSIDHFHVFGTECFVHVPKQRRRKWEKKSVAGRFMGYCDEKDGYRIWMPDINQIVTSRDVLFKPEEIRLPSQMSVKADSSEKNEEEDDPDAEELRLKLNSQWTSNEVECEVETKMEREEGKSEQESRSNKQEEVTEVKQNLILFVDNMGAVKLSKNPEIHKQGKIDIQHIDSENQKADILTKALLKTRFQNLRQQLGIVSEHMNC